MSGPPSDERTRSRPAGALVLALFVVAIVGMMIVPLPTALLDVLLTTNLAIAVALLLVAVYSARTLELSTFPTLLVLTTLFRLALNVSSVRLILLQANAGRVIHAFGAFVVRGDYVVGFAVFLILTIVQYVVISRGAERVAEVAARFTLDAMPGQQLAIDGELRAGSITADEARARRAQLSREAQLYGALDGAMRFVKGDAIAGILILGISLAGGLIIGVARHGMPIGQAAAIYTLLTIGDGLVSQLPALLISTAAGLVVTRVASDQADDSLGRELARQLARPRALAVTALLLGVLALVPGLPLWPFALVGFTAGGLALYLRRRRRGPEPIAVGVSLPRPQPALEVAVDSQLAAQLRAAGPVEERLAEVARTLADDLGLPLPPVELAIDARLPLRGYEVRLRGIPVAHGQIPDGRLLADAGPAALPPGIDAEPAEHPSTGALASWVPSSAGSKLRAAGVGLLDGAGVVAASLEASLRAQAAELLGLDETQRLLDEAGRRHPALVREVVPRRIDVAALAEVLRRLVAEELPVGDLRDVLEAIARQKDPERDPALLTERVRAAMKRQITHRHARDRRLEALVLDTEAEEAVRGALRPGPGETGPQLALEPDLAEALLVAVRRELESLGADGRDGAVLLTSAELRRHLRRLVEREHPRLPVLAYHELDAEVQVERVGTVGLF
jgi:type III secretory pathway component EscV